MSTKGLTKNNIVLEAVNCILENQSPEISLHEIARRLGVKTPSLYNHIKNTKELQYAVFQYAIEKFVNNQKSAIKNKQKDDAIRAYAQAYYTFAMDNKGLYQLIMSMPSEDNDVNDVGKNMALPLLNTFVSILCEYDLSQENIAHWQRVFRAILHGFISEEYLGYFYYYNDVDLKKSQEIAINCFIDGLHKQIDY